MLEALLFVGGVGGAWHLAALMVPLVCSSFLSLSSAFPLLRNSEALL